MYDVIIIGAGPAGLTAGLYTGRFRLKTVIFEKAVVGGQIILSSSIENFPGYTGESPDTLIANMSRQLESVGVTVESEEILALDVLAGGGLQLKAAGKEFRARSVILASGAHYKRLGAENEAAFVGRGVSYCATCDGPLFRQKDVAVVGGGDRALEEAIFLCSYAKTVTLIHRRDEFRASRILQEKLKAEPKLRFELQQRLVRVNGDQLVRSVTLEQVKGGARRDLACDGVFVFVGIEPNTGAFKNVLKTDEAGFIITDQSMATSVPGVFAAGDCRQKTLYQVINACGDAAVAADAAHKFLMGQTK